MAATPPLTDTKWHEVTKRTVNGHRSVILIDTGETIDFHRFALASRGHTSRLCLAAARILAGSLLVVSRHLRIVILVAGASAGCFGVAAQPLTAGVPSPGQPELVRIDQYEDVQTRHGQDPKLTVFVTISGGGYRAANFALGALLALEQIPYPNDDNGNSNLLNEVDYFSTVSGGGMAAALSVLARLSTPADIKNPLLRFVHCPHVLQTIRHNNTARLIFYRLKPDVALTPKTSGDQLQAWLDRSLLQRRKHEAPCEIDEQHADPYTLGDVFKLPGNEVRTPYWFMNATDMSDGRIFPFTPATLEANQVNSYWHRRHWPITAAEQYYDVPLVVGLRSSMNFPAGIPATRLVASRETHRAESSKTPPQEGAEATPPPSSGQNRPRVKYVYLTDGGESDNLGALVAADVLYRERELQQERGRTQSERRLVIVIDAFRGLGSSPSIYDDPRPPGLFASVLRATSLPLDAHRLRVKESFHDASPTRPSILDLLSNDGDVGVAYVHMERESKARRVGTTLHLSRAQQRALICAGKRQALAALGKTGLWEDLRDLRTHRLASAPPDELACAPNPLPPRCQTRDDNCSEIVSFNRSSKEAMTRKLATTLVDALSQSRNAMGNTRRYMEHGIRDQAQAHFRRATMTAIATDIQDMPVPVLKPDDLVHLRASVKQYLRLVDDALNALQEPQATTAQHDDREVRPPEPQDDPEPAIALLWKRFINFAADHGNRLASAIADFFTSSADEETPETGADTAEADEDTPEADEETLQAGEDTPDAGEDTPQAVDEPAQDTAPISSDDKDAAERARSAIIRDDISEALDKMRDAAIEFDSLLDGIPKAGRPGIIVEVQAKLRSLADPHDKLLSAVARPPLHRAENLYGKLTTLMMILNEPSAAATALSSTLESRFQTDLGARKKKVQARLKTRMANAETKAKAAIDEYEDSSLHNELDGLYSDLSSTLTTTTLSVHADAPPKEVCQGLADASDALVRATNRINGITSDYAASPEPDHDPETWALDEQLTSAWTHAPVHQLKTALTDSRLTIGRLKCVWPDMSQRDSVGYDAFVEPGQLSDYSEWAASLEAASVRSDPCVHPSSLPYAPACPDATSATSIEQRSGTRRSALQLGPGR